MKCQKAFGLIEVLISIVVLAIGLLGLASLQSKSLQSIREGDNMATAAMIAQEVATRMLTNPYITNEGRAGYLATDQSGDIATAGGVSAWASDTLTNFPNITRCYAADNSESCFASGAVIHDGSAHATALNNMRLMDEVELRQLAWNLLPEGEIKICFDETNPTSTWACDDTATRIASRNENVFTVKVQWKNINSGNTQQHTQQFTATCTDSSTTKCGN